MILSEKTAANSKPLFKYSWLNSPYLPVSVLTLLSALLSFWDLGSKSYWTDELISYEASSFSLIDVITGKFASDHPPFHYVILKIWWSIFGDSEASLRAISVLPLVLSVPVIYLLANRLFDRKIALAGTALTVLSPGVVLYSRMAIYYGWLLFLVVCSAYTFMRIFYGDRSKAVWAGYVLSSIFVAYTHYFGIFFLMAEGIVFLLFIKNTRPVLIRWLIAVAVIAVAFLPWIQVFLSQLKSSSSSGLAEEGEISLGVTGFVYRIGYALYTFLFGETIQPTNWWLVIPAALVYLAAGASAIWYLVRGKEWNRERQASLIFTIFLAFTFLGYALLTSYVANRTFASSGKHLIFLAPFLFILLAAGAAKLPKRAGLILLVVPAVISLAGLYNYYTNQNFINANYIIPWREITRDIQAKTTNPDVWTGDYGMEFYKTPGEAVYQIVYPTLETDQDWENFKAKKLQERPKQVVVVWRDRGERNVVARTDEAIQFLQQNNYNLVSTQGYIERSAAERSFQEFLLKRPVPQYYIQVYYFQLK